MLFLLGEAKFEVSSAIGQLFFLQTEHMQPRMSHLAMISVWDINID